MAETKELIAETGSSNIGFVLDSWHWWTAGESTDDIRTLTNQDIISCDINDAPRGLERDDQYDNQRELPVATEVIDMQVFLEALATIGYDEPISPEPFSRKLNDWTMNKPAGVQGRQCGTLLPCWAEYFPRESRYTSSCRVYLHLPACGLASLSTAEQ